ncbi:hypothetical protein [Burkholderia ubonensis]|uniref:hypothetical protein n=1 Tax=Burkholderia ubonensis TaxID=101571 RepID=UPI000AB61359|nr:hypothetical protein [Burkholderia ubonensis]
MLLGGQRDRDRQVVDAPSNPSSVSDGTCSTVTPSRVGVRATPASTSRSTRSSTRARPRPPARFSSVRFDA